MKKKAQGPQPLRKIRIQSALWHVNHYFRALVFEPLEDRAMLSVWPTAATAGHATPSNILVGLATPADTSATSNLSPEQVRQAYGLDTYTSSGAVVNAISFHGVAGDGTGQTIAIVDAYDDPDAASDLNTFSSKYGLPQFGSSGPTFTQLNESGGTSLPGADPSGELSGSNNDWELEESLDIEWAHAMAPMANIILFEATSASNSDLDQAVVTAADTSGVVCVSMSWSGAEYSGEKSTDSEFTTPSGHLGGSATSGGTPIAGGITFLAAAGDNGAYASNSTAITPQYPASSPNVVAVGGTTLTVNQSSSTGEYYYEGETSWGNTTSSGTSGGGGGGVSKYEAQPSYQSAVVSSLYSTSNGKYSTSAEKRTYSDISADAATSVFVYDSYSSVGTGWDVEGTSLACPLCAGMIAVADQGRAIVGLGSLNGAQQTLPELYSLAGSSAYSTYFNDVDTGNAIGPTTASSNVPSYSPNIAYDAAYNIATGLGSFKAAAIIPELAGGGTTLAFATTPSSALANAAISPAITVDVVNALGAIVSTDNSNVTISLGANPSGGHLTGTLTVAAVNGVATFSSLQIDTAGSGYTLVASDGSLTAATSAAFSVTSSSTKLAFAQGPETTTVGTSFSPALTVDVENSAGQIATSDNSTVTLSLGANPSSAHLLGTLTAAAVNGVATFSGISIDTIGTGYTLVASDGSLTAAMSAAFNIVAQPMVSTAASASLNSSATGVNLSVAASDPQGEILTYTWTTSSLPTGATSPTFSANQSTAAQNSTATLTSAGAYTFLVTVTNTSGLTATSSISITVSQTLTSLGILQGSSALSTSSQEQLSASDLDQFGNSMGAQSSVTWSDTGGAITSAGLFTAPTTPGTDSITAKANGLTATASATIVAPIGWWKLNEGSGTTANDSGASPADNSTINGGTWTVPSSVTDELHAVQFNGTSSVVSLGAPSKLQYSGAVTLSAWIKPASTSATQYIISDGTSTNSDLFLMLSGGNYEIGSNNGTFQGASYAIPSGDLNNWVHVAGTFDGTTWRLFRDGVQVAAATSSTTIAPTNNWQIGAANSTAQSLTGFFSGGISNARIYGTAINSAAVIGLAAAPPTVATAPTASPSTITGTTTTLSVLGADDYGSTYYTWATLGPSPVRAIFSANGAPGAGTVTATFSQPGAYYFRVIITNYAGLTTTTYVNATVNRTLTSIAVAPAENGLSTTGADAFTATASDQFGAPLVTQPTFAWSVLGGGSVDANGNYTPPYTTGSATVVAASGSVSGASRVTLPGSAQWSSGANASWSGTATWTGTVSGQSTALPGLRGVAGDTVVLNTPSSATLSLNGVSPSVASIVFDSSAGDQIAQGSGGALQLSNGTASANISVAAGNPSIAAPIVLTSNVVVDPAAGSDLTISGGVSGNGQAVTVNGPGTLTLAGTDAYSGGTVVTSGKLVLDGASSLLTGSSLVIGAAPANSANSSSVGGVVAAASNASLAPVAIPAVSSSDSSIVPESQATTPVLSSQGASTATSLVTSSTSVVAVIPRPNIPTSTSVAHALQTKSMSPSINLATVLATKPRTREMTRETAVNAVMTSQSWKQRWNLSARPIVIEQSMPNREDGPNLQDGILPNWTADHMAMYVE